MARVEALLLAAAVTLCTVFPFLQNASAGPPGLEFADGFESGTDAQIAAARAAPDGMTGLPIHDALVTYVKPHIGNDVAGFFIQASAQGPALFIAVDPATLAPSPLTGDKVSFNISEMGTSLGLRQATGISAYSRNASGQPIQGLVQELSLASDLVSAIDDYESELISLAGSVAGAFAPAGTAFESAAVDTLAIIGDPNLRLRLPAALRESEDLEATCEFSLGPTPMWRANAQAQPSAWAPADIAATSCPAPVVVAAVAQSATSVDIQFSRSIDPVSVLADGSQFSFDNGLLATAAVVSGRSVMVNTSVQLPGQPYMVAVANTVTDTLGTAVGFPNAAQFEGYSEPAQVRINEVNGNIASGCDLVELRVVSGGSMSGFQLFERITSVLTFSGLKVETGDIVVVHFDLTDPACYSLPPPQGETLAIDQYPNATYPTNYDTAWDWYAIDAGITNTDNVLTLYDSSGTILDAVFLSDDPKGTAAAPTEQQAAVVAAAGEWERVGGGVPPGGFIDDDFNAHAVQDLNETSTSTAGVSIQRIGDTDTNTTADWGMVEQSWGILNVGQTP